MACKTRKAALANTLEDLSKEDFKKFCHALLDRRDEPRVRRCRVEDKNRWEVADVLVSTFTEDGALRVAVDILKQIGCCDEAKDLAEYYEEADDQTRPDDQNRPVAVSPCDGMHFVDKHKVQLINRVSNIGAILDELLDAKVMQQGVYDEIRAVPTSQGKMRELYAGPLKASEYCKDIFYQILVRNEPYVIKHLEKK